MSTMPPASSPNSIEIEVKCYATLSHFLPPQGQHAMPKGSTVALLIHDLGIDPEEVKIIFINGARAEAHATLADGDRVGLFPPVGGG